MTIAAPPPAPPDTDLVARITALEADVALLKKQLEHAQVMVAVRESRAQFERGESFTIQEVDARMRSKYNIPAR